MNTLLLNIFVLNNTLTTLRVSGQTMYSYIAVLILYVTGPAKIDHLSAKNHRLLACLLHHNLITIYTTGTKSSSLLQNLMGFLLQLTEKG